MSNINTKTYEPCAPCNVAFLGLGVMGFPMAGHLLRAGHTGDRLQPHGSQGASLA
jgi:3-hydroxyisobutyrate dehydrogenase